MKEIDLNKGRELVKLARKAIEDYLRKKEKPSLKEFSEKRGVFVTLKKFPSKELRGCIGYPYPYEPLEKAVIESALSAAFKDDRFTPLEENELNKIVVEVSVLTPPKLIEVKKPEEYLNKIVIGRDGLILKSSFASGLLLPQVATEYKMDAKEFLTQLCFKAGLDEGAWKEPFVKIYSFQAQVFCEKTPGGEVIEEKN